MVFLVWTGLVEAGMLVVGCARRVENIEKLASQLTQHTGKVKNFVVLNQHR
jgi:NADP-dependent 3-hydroxy acid dehydrogenase YdfG